MLVRLSWRTLCRGTIIGSLTTGLLLAAAPWIADPTPGRDTRLFIVSCLAAAGAIAWVAISRWRPRDLRFSLRSMLVLVGLGLCLATLARDGGPWTAVYTLPGRRPVVVMSPNGRFIASTAYANDASIEVHDVRSGELLATVKHPGIKPLSDMAFSSDGDTLLMQVQEPSTLPQTSCVTRLVEWRTDVERHRWTGSRAGPIAESGDRFFQYAIDAPAWPEIAVYKIDCTEPLLIVPNTTFPRHQRGNAVSSTGRYLLLRGALGLDLWHVDERRRIGTIEDRDFVQFGSIGDRWVVTRFSPDDRYLALATQKGVDIWDVTAFRQIGRWEPKEFTWLESLRWSGRGDRFCATFVEQSAPGTRVEHSFLVDRQGREIARIVGTDAAFTRAGDRLAVLNGSVYILDAETGRELTVLPIGGGRSAIRVLPFGRPISFSPDGDWLVHNGGATVWHRQRSERWWGVLTLPAFWGSDLFLILLLAPLSRKLPSPALWLTSHPAKPCWAPRPRRRHGPDRDSQDVDGLPSATWICQRL